MIVACSFCGEKFPVESPKNDTAETAPAKKTGKAKFKGFGDAPTSAPTKVAEPPAPEKKSAPRPPQPAGPPSQPQQRKEPSPPPTRPASPPSPRPPEPAIERTEVRPPPSKSSSATPPETTKRSTPKVDRSVKRATFVTVDPAETNIHLGEDGKLPELVLNKTKSPEEDEAASTSGKTPWAMIAALVGSLAASVLLLFAPVGEGPVERSEQKTAREVLKDYYIRNTFNPNAPPEEYQNVLRQAIRAHDQGDFNEEKRLYRRTLDMLASEDLNELRGLTGVPKGKDHPSDPMLRKLLAELLRQ